MNGHFAPSKVSNICALSLNASLATNKEQQPAVTRGTRHNGHNETLNYLISPSQRAVTFIYISAVFRKGSNCNIHNIKGLCKVIYT